MKKRNMAGLFMAVVMAVSVTACGSSSGGSQTEENVQTPSAEAEENTANADQGDVYSGINAFEACEWAADKYPDATVVRYTNNTSTGTFETNGGAIPAEVLYLAVNLPIETEGRYRVELYADGMLAKSTDDIVSGLKSGAFEMNCLSVANFGSYTDAFTEMSVPFLFSTEDQVKSALEAGLKDAMCSKAEADIEGVLFKGIAPFGFREMTNNKQEIVTPDDLKGLKMRILTDPLQVTAFEAMGASVTNVTYSELYTSLQQGTIDGLENPISVLYSGAYHEVAKNLMLDGHIRDLSSICISADVFQSLTEEQQGWLIESCEAAGEYQNELAAKADEECLQKMKDAGVTVNEVDEAAFKAAAESFYSDPEISAMWTEGLVDTVKEIIQ